MRAKNTQIFSIRERHIYLVQPPFESAPDQPNKDIGWSFRNAWGNIAPDTGKMSFFCQDRHASVETGH